MIYSNTIFKMLVQTISDEIIASSILTISDFKTTWYRISMVHINTTLNHNNWQKKHNNIIVKDYTQLYFSTQNSVMTHFNIHGSYIDYVFTTVFQYVSKCIFNLEKCHIFSTNSKLGVQT